MKRIISILLFCTVMCICCACSTDDPTAPHNYGIQSNPPHQADQNGNGNLNNGTNKDYTYKEVESHCEQLVAQGNALSAYQYIKNKANMDSSYSNLLQKYTKIYVDDTLQTAASYAANKNYQQAVYILREANKIYNCSEFNAKITEYKAYLPCKLPFLKRIDDNNYAYMLDAEDCFGNQYQEVFGFNGSLGSDDGGYAIFYLNGKYTNLNGTFVGSSDLYKDMEVDCKIYADGNLIYKSQKLGRTSAPVNINLNIQGVEQLRIEYMWYSWWTTDPCCIFDLTAS